MSNVMMVLGGLIAAVVAAVLTWVVAGRSRRDSLPAAQSALAVAESRLADLSKRHAELEQAHRTLGDQHLALSKDRERLGTALDRTTADFDVERAASIELRQALEQTRRQVAQLEADLRVSRSSGETQQRQVAQLEERLRIADESNRQHSESLANLAARASALETERDGLKARLAEQKTWVEEQTRLFEQKIANVAGQLLEEKSRAFTEVNRKEMDAVVTPFKEQLKEFRERVDAIYASDTRDRGQLHEQILQLTSLNQVVSQQAQALTKALTISSKSTGDWGEMVLKRILEDSELRAAKEYVLQQTVEGEDASRQRPDAIVYLPEGRQVVVDAKVSNKAWTDYCAAEDETTRESRLVAHVASLRTHIRELSARDYPRSPELKTVDFVLMFVPVEAALLTALARDETLYQEAYRSKIVLVTPTTLMAVLKLIEGMWLVQRRKESADKIADAGRKLYEKLTVFADTFLEVGAQIERAHGTFERARGQLSTGRGNAIRLAQQMVGLGVGPSPGKTMPAALVQLAETDSPDQPVGRLASAAIIQESHATADVADEQD